MKYSEKLKDPRWQKIRLKVLERDEWTCQRCGDSENTLNVHHCYYEPEKEPWEYPLEAFTTLCDNCHSNEKTDMLQSLRILSFVLQKQRFFAKDVLEIARGFNSIKYHYHTPEVTALIIKWVLKSPDIFHNLGDLYLKVLKENKG